MDCLRVVRTENKGRSNRRLAMPWPEWDRVQRRGRRGTARSGPAGLRWERAPDIRRRLARIARAVGFRHVNAQRLFAVRTYGSRANALARIWGLSGIFQRALGLPAAYVVEVLHPAFDRLSRAEQDRVLIHELLHIPTTFSGSLRPEQSRNFRTHHTVSRLYRLYLANRRRA